MTRNEAIAILAASKRYELADYAFGDSEFTWRDDNGKEIAYGYRGRSGNTVVLSSQEFAFTNKECIEFNVFKLGTLARFERNDAGMDY